MLYTDTNGRTERSVCDCDFLLAHSWLRGARQQHVPAAACESRLFPCMRFAALQASIFDYYAFLHGRDSVLRKGATKT